MVAAQYACVVSLRDQLFRLVDTRPVILVAIAPSDSSTPSPTTGVSSALTPSPVPHNSTCPSNGTCLDFDAVDACAAICPRFADLACFVPVAACHSTQVAWVAGLSAGALALLGLAACVAVFALRCRRRGIASLCDLQRRHRVGPPTASKQSDCPPAPISPPVNEDSLMRAADGPAGKTTKHHHRLHGREHNHAITTTSDSADKTRAVVSVAVLDLEGPGVSSGSDSLDDTSSNPRATHGLHAKTAAGSQPAVVASRPRDGVVSHQIHPHRHHRHSHSTATSTLPGEVSISGGMPVGSNTAGDAELPLALSRSHWQAFSRGIATAVSACYQQPSPGNTTTTAGRGVSTDRTGVTHIGDTVVVQNPMNFPK